MKLTRAELPGVFVTPMDTEIRWTLDPADDPAATHEARRAARVPRTDATNPLAAPLAGTLEDLRFAQTQALTRRALLAAALEMIRRKDREIASLRRVNHSLHDELAALRPPRLKANATHASHSAEPAA